MQAPFPLYTVLHETRVAEEVIGTVTAVSPSFPGTQTGAAFTVEQCVPSWFLLLSPLAIAWGCLSSCIFPQAGRTSVLLLVSPWRSS